MTRTLVVGGGSIGLRHATVLATLGAQVAVVTGRSDLPQQTYGDLESGLAGFQPDYVVIANETTLHADALLRLSAAGFSGSVLVEKPMSAPPELASGFGTIGIDYNLRFHPVMVALAETLGTRRVLTAEVYAGQLLDTWRPGRAVAEQYSAHRERGGGVLRDLSHELDYLGMLFGDCRGVFALGGRLGTVTVDSDDAWAIVAEYERAPVVSIQLNYLDTAARRRLVVNADGSTIEADLVASTLTVDGETTSFPADRDLTYRRLHEAMLERGGDGVTTPAEATTTDDLILAIENSAEERRWVTTT
jgi:predicted dehydrogenase